MLVPTPVQSQSWAAIDALRTKLSAHGVRVIQRDCATRGLQGAYHPKNDILIVCRAHRNPAQVWNTLAHEATHRMQRCAGGSITLPSQHRMMSRVLRRETPQEWQSIRAYPRSQHLAEFSLHERGGTGRGVQKSNSYQKYEIHAKSIDCMPNHTKPAPKKDSKSKTRTPCLKHPAHAPSTNYPTLTSCLGIFQETFFYAGHAF